MPKVNVPCLCSRSQPGIKVIIRELRGHLLHTVTFLVKYMISRIWLVCTIRKPSCEFVDIVYSNIKRIAKQPTK